MPQTLLQLLLIGAIMEALIHYLRLIWHAPSRRFSSITWWAVLVICVLIAILGEHDWFSVLWDGLPDIVNQIITGFLFARAAMFVHDVYKKVM